MDNKISKGELFDKFLELSDMSSVFKILSRFEYVFLHKIIKIADKKPETDNKVYLEEIKNEIGIPMPKISEMIQVMNDEGLLAWKLDSSTKKTYVEVTGAGREKCLLQKEGMKTISNRIDNEITEDEKANIFAGLLKVGKIINEERGEAEAFFDILSNKVSDNMNIISLLKPKSKVFYLKMEYYLDKAIEVLEKSKYTTLPVINEEGVYVGTVSDGDILWYINRHGMDGLDKVHVEDIVNVHRNPAVHDFDDSNTIVKNIMDQNFLCMVDDRGCFIGIITRKDVIRYMKNRIEHSK